MDQLKLYLGTGVEGLRPEGYRTIDINPDNKPDIVADARRLGMLADGSADEFYASHVLEHFAWPDALLVLAEWARILRFGGTLKVAVPDMEVYAALLLSQDNVDVVMGDVFGGHWAGAGQGHLYGYTKRTLAEILQVLGFSDFDYWTSDLPEAANGWMVGQDSEQIGISLNVKATKIREPLVSIVDLHARLRASVREPFSRIVRSMLGDSIDEVPTNIGALMYQRLQFKFLELKAHSDRLQKMLDENEGAKIV